VRLGPVGHRARLGRPDVITAPHRLRLTRRGRALAWLTAAAAVALIGFGLVEAAAPAAPPVLTQRTVTVAPGQTAWEVAEAVNPSVDPRVTLTAVERLNGLESTGLVQPGQQLRVPVYAAS
jgi:LysM repeat protein